jgi:hypothetical protein
MGVTGYAGFVMDKQAETPMPKGEPIHVARPAMAKVA